MTLSIEQRVEIAAAEYLRAADSGAPPDRTEFLNRYSDVADELAEFLDDLARFRVASTPKDIETPPGAAATATFAGSRTVEISESPLRIPGYEILGEVGRGGMGVVYRARQVSINRLVALKTISPDRLETRDDRDRFLREAEAAATLDHPNIVPIYEVGEADGRSYFTMKLVEGGSLGDVQKKYRSDPRGAAELVARIARAVHYAHQRGILHRDLKPSNVLLDSTGEPMVADFGLAKRIDGSGDASKSGVIVGTPSYMAPEQARGEKAISTAADVYGLGAILYQLLTGKPPFQAETAAETLVLVLSSEIARPRSLNASAPVDLELICLRCLAKRPNERYGSASELTEDLQRWLSGEVISVRPTSRAERVAKWIRRNPAITAVYSLLAVAMLFAIGGGGSYWMWRSAEANRVRLAGALKGEQTARADAAAAKLREDSGRDAFDQLAYLYQVHLAYQEWKDNPTTYRAEALLNECPESRRGWEWWFVKRLCQGGVAQILVHPAGVQCVDFSPDGQFLATLNGTSEVRVWNIKNGNSLFTAKGRLCVRFSADSHHLITAGSNNRLVFLNSLTGASVKTVELDESRLQAFLALSPDLKYLACPGRDSRTVDVVDVNTGRTKASMAGHKSGVTNVAYSRDGKLLVSSSSDGTAKIWDTETWREKLSIAGHGFRSYGAAFSPDGLQVATAGWDQTVRVWNTETGREIRLLKGEGLGFVKVAYSPDGRWLAATTTEGLVRLWDAKSFVEAATLKGHTESAWGLAFSPDSQQIACGGGDSTARVWNVARTQAAMIRGGNSQISAVAISPDSCLIATAGGFNTGEQAQIIVWESTSGVARLRLTGATIAVRSLAFSSDGTRLVAAGRNGAVTIWNAFDGKLISSLPPHELNDYQTIALSPNGGFLAIGAPDHSIQLWDLHSGAMAREFRGHSKLVARIAFSGDGRHLVSADFDNAGPTRPSEVKIWDVHSGKEEATLRPRTRVSSVAMNNNGRLVAIGNADHSVSLWDLATATEIRAMKGHTRPVESVCFNPDSTRLVTADADWTISIWDVKVGKETIRFRSGSNRPFFSDRFQFHVVACSPDGNKIVWAGFDGTLRIWDGSPMK